MRTIAVLGFLQVLTVTSMGYEVRNGVVIDEHNGSYLFAFPSPNKQLGSSSRPAGEIRIGGNIVLKYSLKVSNGGKSRFVQVNASKLPGKLQRRAPPALRVDNFGGAPGFYIRDSRQPRLDIHISPPILFALRSALAKQSLSSIQDTLAKEGNLSVLIGKTVDGGKIYFRITRIVVE